MKSSLIDSLYKASIVEGRKEFCPRIGFYRHVEVFKATRYEKDTLVMKANWKQKAEDKYDPDFIVEIQLTSLILNANDEQRKLINDKGLIGKEIEVYEASYNSTEKIFSLRFSIREADSIGTASINSMLKSGGYNIFDQLLEEARTSEVVPDLVVDEFPDFVDEDESDPFSK